jgi:hypothetical protein
MFAAKIRTYNERYVRRKKNPLPILKKRILYTLIRLTHKDSASLHLSN